MLAQHLTCNSTWFEEFDFLASVPSSRGADRRREWDPVGEIVRCLEPIVTPNWDVIAGAVIKTRETPAMQGRDLAARQAIASGPLRRSLRVPDGALVAGARVLVVDDVMTEGSTLREVARALLVAGAAEVAGLVVARSAWPGSRGRMFVDRRTDLTAENRASSGRPIV
jgi:predicted amidophosphoribosyltransferase